MDIFVSVKDLEVRRPAVIIDLSQMGTTEYGALRTVSHSLCEGVVYKDK